MADAKRTAIITGASSGIGRATAEEFARQGFHVAVVARRKELLDTLLVELSKLNPKGEFLAHRCDVTQWNQVNETVEQIGRAMGHINVLVNNAGAFEYASLEKSSPQKLDEMIDVNVRGVIYMTKAALPFLKKSVQAHSFAKIINVSSVAGLWGFANMSVYTATKYAVTGFTSGLSRELRGQGIQVASIHPGPVQSKVTKDNPKPRKKFVMSSEQVATQIFELAVSKRGRRISHPIFTLLNAIDSISPGTVDKVLKKIL